MTELHHTGRGSGRFTALISDARKAAAAGNSVRLLFRDSEAAHKGLELARHLRLLADDDDPLVSQVGSGVIVFSWPDDPMYSGAGN